MKIQLELEIDDRLVRLIRRVFARRVLVALAVLVAAGAAAGLYAQSTALHVFHPGTVISSSEVNENFAMLETKLEALPTLPAGCPAGQVAVSTGAEGWACAVSCPYSTGDCNGAMNDGCETSLATHPDHCGKCDAVCSGNHMATRACSNGACVGACQVGFGDCNADRLLDGCEVDLRSDPMNCSACGVICPGGGSCVNGTCL